MCRVFLSVSEEKLWLWGCFWEVLKGPKKEPAVRLLSDDFESQLDPAGQLKVNIWPIEWDGTWWTFNSFNWNAVFFFFFFYEGLLVISDGCFPISHSPFSFSTVHPRWGEIFGKTKPRHRDLVSYKDLFVLHWRPWRIHKRSSSSSWTGRAFWGEERQWE